MTTKKRPPAKKSTPPPAREETVAALEPEDAPEDASVESREESNAPEATQSAPQAADPGFCDNHPDRPAALVTDFRYAQPQRFCGPCVPPSYRHLL